MEKHILVALPLSQAQRETIRQAAPQFAYRFTTQETVTLEEILWADAILGNVPVELIRQNQHLAWFQSNFAGPDPYLEPGVLPADCVVTNATGAYGLAISEWMLGMWLGLCKDLFLYRDRQNRCEWDAIERPVRGVAGARVLCVGLGDIGSSFARRAHAMGAQAHIPHGRANAILLPYVMSYNAGCESTLTPTAERYAALAAQLGLGTSSIRQSALNLIHLVRRMESRMKMPMSIREAGLSESDFEAMLDNMTEAALADRCMGTTPVPCTADEVRALYRQAYYKAGRYRSL